MKTSITEIRIIRGYAKETTVNIHRYCKERRYSPTRSSMNRVQKLIDNKTIYLDDVYITTSLIVLYYEI